MLNPIFNGLLIVLAQLVRDPRGWKLDPGLGPLSTFSVFAPLRMMRGLVL